MAPFGAPLPGLTQDERNRFEQGKETFEEADEVADGLGLVFNGRSCAGCHRGQATGGGANIFATRIGAYFNNRFDPLVAFGGPALQVNGIGPVGNGVVITGEVVPPQATVVARRRTTPLFGLGLVDAVDNRTLEDLAARQRRTQPDTAGRVNLVTDLRTGRPTQGRFGWKAQVGSLYDFAVDAYKEEIGITTGGFTIPGAVDSSGQPLTFPFARTSDGRSVSEENAPQGDVSLLAFDPVPGPDDNDDEDSIRFADFMRMLAPPPRNRSVGDTSAGEAVFNRIGCANCHLPSLTTGRSSIRALNQVTFQPYSDFLVHDMGSLGDGIEAGTARGREMRTAPLWGLRTQPSFLHDGRAQTVDQAIRMHDGQGRDSTRRYANLGSADKQALMKFLNSL